jgi:hypothetical protein
MTEKNINSPFDGLCQREDLNPLFSRKEDARSVVTLYITKGIAS